MFDMKVHTYTISLSLTNYKDPTNTTACDICAVIMHPVCGVRMNKWPGIEIVVS